MADSFIFLFHVTASKTVSEFTVLDTRETATTTDVRPSLADRYRISSYYKVTMDELKPTVESLYAREQAGTDAKTENSIGYQTSFFRQVSQDRNILTLQGCLAYYLSFAIFLRLVTNACGVLVNACILQKVSFNS